MGIALIAMAENLGTQMASRALEHLLQYGEPPVRRAVPLAMGLLYTGDPDPVTVDTLSRLSHDADTEVRKEVMNTSSPVKYQRLQESERVLLDHWNA
jgi:hypothetical protein